MSGPAPSGSGPSDPAPSQPGPEPDRSISASGLDPGLRLGVQLPPAPTDAAGAERWLATAAAAEDAGFGTVWVAGDEVDPCTLAGGLAARTASILLGVVAGVGAGDRNPSVLARELTALDVLSGGRAAVLLEPGAGWERTAEAAEVCHLLFAGEVAHYRGRHFHLAGAVNRPGPARPGGPPVLLAAAPGVPTDGLASVPGQAGLQPSGTAPPRGAAAALPADAWVVGGGPDEIAAWRDRAGVPAVLWRGTVGPEPDVARTVTTLREAGAAGAIVRLTSPASPEAVAAAGRALAAAWAS